MIRTLASIINFTSTFWHRCQGIGVLNNFLFNFFRVSKFYLFIYLFTLVEFYFICFYLSKK
ncbi:MAG: hypothetical protein K6253_02755 [Candidatus Liberibacter asiaticus]|nr:hypothetical protein [Candidatus Liberibacter asiaticus]